MKKKILINFQNSGHAFKTTYSGCVKDNYFTALLNLSLCYCAGSNCLAWYLHDAVKAGPVRTEPWAKMSTNAPECQ